MQQCLVSTFGEKLLRHCPQMGYHNFGEQNNLHPLVFLLPSIQSWGVCLFSAGSLNSSITSHGQDGERKVYFLFKLSWQNVREALKGRKCLN